MGPKTEGRQRLSELAKRRHAEGTLQGSSAARMDEIRKLAHEKQRKGRIAKRVAEEAMVERNAQRSSTSSRTRSTLQPADVGPPQGCAGMGQGSLRSTRSSSFRRTRLTAQQSDPRRAAGKLVGEADLASGPAAAIIRRRSNRRLASWTPMVVERWRRSRSALATSTQLRASPQHPRRDA
jgi:hypothetical protein